jgi:hypothetical protein
MPRRPVSVTLEADNLTWLKGRAGPVRRADRRGADALGLPLLTRDAPIRESGTVEVLWSFGNSRAADGV